jgi:imidazolonepropionase-like amidohydrolase
VYLIGLCILASYWPVIGWAQDAVAHPKFDTVILGGWLFETESGTFAQNRGIGILNGRFASLNLEDQVKNLESSLSEKQIIRLDDQRYILPGLIDCHAHYNVKLIKRRREEFEVMPVVYLANGVTVTFSCGEFDPEKMEDLRKRIDSSEQVGPKLINSGPYFGRARPGWRGEKPESEIREEVDYWAGRGVGGFKAKQIAPAELRALIDQAHKHGLTVTGHLDSGFRSSVNPRDAIDFGIDRIEHFLGGNAMLDSKPAYDTLGSISAEMPEYKSIVQKFVEHGTWFDATLTAYGYFGHSGEEFNYWFDERTLFTPYIQELVKSREATKPNEQFVKIYQAKMDTIGAYYRAGGKLTLGTDHVSDGNHLPGFGAHRELDAFVRGGIPAVDAIRIGTIKGARALKIDQDHGSIEIGKVADLFVVRGNPLENIRHTRNVEHVLSRGRVHQASELLAGVAGRLGPASDQERESW